MKKELIEKIMSMTHPTQDLAYIGKGYLQQILEEELPDFQRIDEERFKRIYASKVCDIGLHIKEYNSTLPPALVPLPKEKPKDFFRVHSGNDADDLWDWVVKHYGTPEPKPEYIRGKDKVLDDFCDSFEQQEAPAKPNLPSVEELAKEIASVRVDLVDEHKLSHKIAKKIHDKYSLHTREWWQGDIKGMKVIHTQCGDEKIELSGKIFVEATSNLVFDVNKCTPYTPPTAQEIIAKHNLSDEEVRAIREGKC